MSDEWVTGGAGGAAAVAASSSPAGGGGSPAPGLVNTGRPLPLALHQCDPRLQQRLQSRIAVGMGAHVRLGTESLLQRIPKELLERIVKHLEYGLPFHEFIYEDLHAKCPGLTPAFSLLQRLAFQDCTEIVARIFSFIRFLHEAAERQKKAQWPWRCRPSHELGSITSQNADPLMNWDQLQSTVPGGQEITEDVADILLKRVAGLLGVDILSRGVKISGGARWTELAVPRQCLVLDTSAVDALVNAHNGPTWPVAGQFPSDEHVQAVKEAFACYAHNVNALIAPYELAVWAICSRDVTRWTVFRPSGGKHHYMSMSMTKRPTTHGTLIEGQVWDPARRMPALDLFLACAMDSLVKEKQGQQGDQFIIQAPPSHQRIQEHGTGTVFHTLLNIAAQCTGISLPGSDEECAVFAAALQGHCYMALLTDWVDCGLTLDVDAVFREWLAADPAPAILLAGTADGGGPPSSLRPRRPLSLRHGALEAVHDSSAAISAPSRGPSDPRDRLPRGRQYDSQHHVAIGLGGVIPLSSADSSLSICLLPD
jgi:hypothetical protein